MSIFILGEENFDSLKSSVVVPRPLPLSCAAISFSYPPYLSSLWPARVDIGRHIRRQEGIHDIAVCRIGR